MSGTRSDDYNTSWALRKQHEDTKKKDNKSSDEAEQHRGADAASNGETTARQRAPAAAADEEERPSRPRILAYSDSDSDVETHIQRVKEHILPQLEKLAPPAEDDEATKEAEAVAAAAAAEAAAVAEAARTSSRSNLTTAAAAALSNVMKYITPGVIVKAAGLFYARTLHPRAGQGAETAAVVAGAAGLLLRRQRSLQTTNTTSTASSSLPPRRLLADRIPAPVEQHAIELGAAAAFLIAARTALDLHRNRRTTGRVLRRLSTPVNIDALREAERLTPERPPESPAEWAVVYRPEMTEMKRMLKECSVDLPSPRFDDTDAELMRFATACGLRQAETPAQRGSAIERAVRRVILACEWSAANPPLTEVKLHRWERLVAWRGADAAGCPILLVRLGRALQLCTKDGRLEAFVAAIASQVAIGLATRTTNQPDGPDKFVAVVDCRETSNWSALVRSRQVLALAHGVASNLTQHFPERLKTVFLLELPLVARMQVQSVVSSLPEVTRDKIVHALSTDESLPITVANLQRRRSCARGLGRRSVSEASFATTECSTPGREGNRDEDDEDQEGGVDGESVAAALADAAAAEVAQGEKELAEAAQVALRTSFETTTGAGAGDDVDIGAGSNDAAIAAIAPVRSSQEFVASAALPPVATAIDTASTSPATEEVAANLLGALDRAAAAVSSASPPSENQPVKENSAAGGEGGSAATAATAAASPGQEEASSSRRLSLERAQTNSNSANIEPSSHQLPDTPSMLSPQTSVSSAEGASLAATADTTSHGGVVHPFAGVTAFLSNVLPSFSPSNVRSSPRPDTTARLPSPRLPSRLRAHRVPSVVTSLLSAENSLSSLPETPPPPETSLLQPKGGLSSLPPRPRTASGRKTPAKSSLRRSRSQEPPRTRIGTISSYPLRRQTSVSWAENLERVREIEASPSPSPAPSGRTSLSNDLPSVAAATTSTGVPLTDVTSSPSSSVADAAAAAGGGGGGDNGIVEDGEPVSAGALEHAGSGSGDGVKEVLELAGLQLGGGGGSGASSELQVADTRLVREDAAFQLMLLLMLTAQLLKMFLGL